jgi:hypothetical protein
MLKALIDFLLNRKGHPTQHDTATMQEAPVAPYKVETPAPAKCGCGRSQSGLCVGLHKLTPEEWAVHSDNPKKAPEKTPAVKAKTARAKKAPAPAAAPAPADKPKKAPSKAPAAPRKPRTVKQ